MLRVVLHLAKLKLFLILIFCLCVTKFDTFDWWLYPFKTMCAFTGCERSLSRKSCFCVILHTERNVQPMWLYHSGASKNRYKNKSICRFSHIAFFKLNTNVSITNYFSSISTWVKKLNWKRNRMSDFLYVFLPLTHLNLTEINCTSLCNPSDHVL